jgi:hypothetical protein
LCKEKRIQNLVKPSQGTASKMEAAGNGTVQISGGQGEQQLMISGVGGDQPLVMSAEDAAQFLAQAGLQLADVTDSGEQIIINSDSLQNAAGLVKVCFVYFCRKLGFLFCKQNYVI